MKTNPARKAIACNCPAASHLRDHLGYVDHTDAFKIGLNRTDLKIQDIHAAIFGHLPAAFRALLYMRTIAVAPLGIGGPRIGELIAPVKAEDSYRVGDKIGRWKIYALSENQIITGGDDKHLDFRVSVLRVDDGHAAEIVVTTAVQTHNKFGRVYLATILPFHRIGVAQLLTNAAAANRI